MFVLPFFQDLPTPLVVPENLAVISFKQRDGSRDVITCFGTRDELEVLETVCGWLFVCTSPFDCAEELGCCFSRGMGLEMASHASNS